MGCDVGSVGIETSILPEGDTFFSFRLCMVIYPAKATNNPHGLMARLTIGSWVIVEARNGIATWNSAIGRICQTGDEDTVHSCDLMRIAWDQMEW